MNIRDYWPLQSPPENTPETWRELIAMRLSTFQGFAEKESQRGLVQPKVNINTSKGQEIMRILAFRVIEELAESFESIDPDHAAEELIDAINYLLSIFLLGEEIAPNLEVELTTLSQEYLGTSTSKRITIRDMGQVSVVLGAHLGDLLRNRAWMTHAQSTYFDGDLLKILSPVFQTIFKQFSSFEEFWLFYVAKDNVLQFRLRSNY